MIVSAHNQLDQWIEKRVYYSHSSNKNYFLYRVNKESVVWFECLGNCFDVGMNHITEYFVNSDLHRSCYHLIEMTEEQIQNVRDVFHQRISALVGLALSPSKKMTI